MFIILFTLGLFEQDSLKKSYVRKLLFINTSFLISFTNTEQLCDQLWYGQLLCDQLWCDLKQGEECTSLASCSIQPLQGSAKEWSLGCVKRAPAAKGGQDAEITQPRDDSLADPCTACI